MCEEMIKLKLIKVSEGILMRPNNSVGGYRLYPSSPLDADTAELGVAALGQFNEGMDRLNRERQLTQREQYLVDHLNPNSQLARNYRSVCASSDRLWQLALDLQQQLNRRVFTGPYTMQQLATLLAQCANQWQELRDQLE